MKNHYFCFSNLSFVSGQYILIYWYVLFMIYIIFYKIILLLNSNENGELVDAA